MFKNHCRGSIYNCFTWVAVLRQIIADEGIPAKVLVNAVCVPTTGYAVGPDFMAVLTTLGQRKVEARLYRAASL